ncbi:hypothetical protein GCM10009551_094970 [Nocardiopsis tropica]|uniref:NPCBM/NEW2 domain-containing protein n=1 Tax=Tsukamurella strandjordii TaxID=147577 RepID=UPI0031DD6BC7
MPIACALALAVAGCGSQSSASDGAHRTEHGSSAVAAPASAERATPTGTPLYARLSSANAGGDTGRALTAVLGGATYPGATGIWVGCEGTASTAIYRLAGEFSTLTGTLGLQPHTPEELQVRIEILVDGQSRFAQTLDRDDQPAALAIPLAGAASLTVSALATDGRCTPAGTPYGAIGAASLT